MHLRAAAAVLAAGCALGGCGSATSSRAGRNDPKAATATASALSAGGPTNLSTSTRASGAPVHDLRAAERPRSTQFPAVQGRSLRQVAAAAKTSAQLTAATGFYTPGLNRYAFGLSPNSGGFIYAPSAVYIAASPDAPASGPFLAPADPVAVAPRYRSQQFDPDAVKAVYNTQLPLRHSGVYALLVLTRTPRGLVGSSNEVAVSATSPIPAVGGRPPDIETDTLQSVHGDRALLTTRQPPEDLNAVSLNQVLGRKPVAVLFSTPALCVSRVCGPVTDIIVELQHEFGSHIAFIHQEVFVDNDPAKGLRPQLKAFHLETEPWLFTINAQGIIRARLDGAFGIGEARAALRAALR